MPIPGRPPSLIALPSGCSFQPALPLRARAAPARRAAPRARAGRDRHLVACLLDRATRRQLWHELKPASCPSGADSGEAGGQRRERGARRGARPRQALPDHARDHVPAPDRRRACGRRRVLRRRCAARRSGIVGETGCGKSTTARLIMRLLEPTSGTIRFDGRGHRTMLAPRAEAAAARDADRSSRTPTRRSTRARPSARSSPSRSRSTASRRASERRKRAVQELMEQVGLNPEHYNRYPHEFSGGQRQRIGVARALALKPKLVIADEPVSALDVSIQAQILNLLRELQRELGLTLILIAHDLSVVRHMCDRIAVMYLGKIVELARQRGALRAPAPPLHRRAAVGGAGPRPRARRAPPARRAAAATCRARRTRRRPAASTRAARRRRRSARRWSRRSSPRARARSPPATSRSRRKRRLSEWQPPAG